MADVGLGSGDCAIYVCVPHYEDFDQTPVDDQERLGRARALALGFQPSGRLVFVDPLRAVWKPECDAPGFGAMIEAVKAGQVTAVFVHRITMIARRRATDFEALLEVCDAADVRIVGFGGGTAAEGGASGASGAVGASGASGRADGADASGAAGAPGAAGVPDASGATAPSAASDAGGPLGADGTDNVDLDDPRQRDELFREAQLSRDTADRASLMARAGHAAAASAGRPHGGGRRAFGYQAGMRALVQHEARVVQEIFERYLAGEALGSLAADLNRRRVPTSEHRQWTSRGVARILDAPRYAGLRVFQGGVQDGDGYRFGTWEPCVSVDTWELARRERSARAEAASDERRNRLRYLLAGLVLCSECSRRMAGNAVSGYRLYACPGPGGTTGRAPKGCARSIGADSLERRVAQDIVALLESWGPEQVIGPDALMIGRREFDGSVPAPDSYRSLHGTVAVRPASGLDGVEVGARARSEFDRLPAARRSDVFRFLLAGVFIGPKSTSRGVFDDSRVRLAWQPGITPVIGDGSGFDEESPEAAGLEFVD